MIVTDEDDEWEIPLNRECQLIPGDTLIVRWNGIKVAQENCTKAMLVTSCVLRGKKMIEKALLKKALGI